MPVNDAAVCGFDTAHQALVMGCRFLIARAATDTRGQTAHPRVALRHAGNCLKELDRMLSVLLDECASVRGMTPAAYDAPGQTRDVALQWHKVADAPVAVARLRAIARVRHVACGDGLTGHGLWAPRDMAMAVMGRQAAAPTAAGPAPAGFRLPRISDEALGIIAEFYLTLAVHLGHRHGGLVQTA